MFAGLIFAIMAIMASYTACAYCKIKLPGYYASLQRHHVTLSVAQGMLEASMHSIDQRLVRWWSRRSNRVKWLYGCWYRLGSFYGPLAQLCIMIVLTVNVAVAGVQLVSSPHLHRSGDAGQITGNTHNTSEASSGVHPLASSIYSTAGAGNSHDVALMIPGVTVPLAHVVYIFAALIINAVFHEMGHAIAATIENVPVNACGVYVYILYPGAFVDVAVDALNRLAPAKQQRIYSAGVFNNLAVAMTTYVAAMTVIPLFLSILYSTGSGALVCGVDNRSPLFGSLIAGQHAIVRVHSPTGVCVVDTTVDWYRCLDIAITSTHAHTQPPARQQESATDTVVPSAHALHHTTGVDEESVWQPWMNPVNATDPRFPITLPVAPPSEWGYCVTDEQIRTMRRQQTHDTRSKALEDEDNGVNIPSTHDNPDLAVDVTDCCRVSATSDTLDNNTSGDAYSFRYSIDSWAIHPPPDTPGWEGYARDRRRSAHRDPINRPLHAINRPLRAINSTSQAPTCECMPARSTVANIPCRVVKECTTFNSSDTSAVRCMVPIRPHPTVHLFRIDVADVRTLKQHTQTHRPNYRDPTTMCCTIRAC